MLPAAVLYVADYFSKNAFLDAGIKFPSSLVGMFAIAALLIVLGEETAAKVRGFFAPALNWIAKWLSLFYVASLVTLPLALKGLSSERDLGFSLPRFRVQPAEGGAGEPKGLGGTEWDNEHDDRAM